MVFVHAPRASTRSEVGEGWTTPERERPPELWWVRLYGWRVNESLASHLGEFATTTASEAAEQALAAELCERGYCVRVGPKREAQCGR
jgi:hypothetical protein